MPGIGSMRDMAVERERKETTDPIVIYPRRWKLVLFACGALGFTLAGLAIGLASDWRTTPTVVVATYIGVPFFGFGFLYLTFRLVVRKPALVVSDEGILDNASAVGAGLIRWDEVKDIRATSFGAERMLVIVPKDEAAILARQNLVKRLVMRMNKSLSGYIVCIPGNILPMPCDELRDEIKHYWKAWRSRARARP